MATLSACLVVKNGKASILRCLDALLPMANEYVIIDTGSTDGTLELIAGWREKHPNPKYTIESVGARFHDEDGIFDFGAAKNYAIECAHGDYIMWCDVNDILLDGARARQAFDQIVAKYPTASITMNTKVSPQFQFPRTRIVKRENAKFVGSIHEYLTNSASDSQTVKTGIVFENYKQTRDVSRNIKALEKEWTKERTQRTAFYLGNSYRDMKDLGHAYEWYTVAVDEFPEVRTEDRYKSLETICEILTIGRADVEDLGTRSLQMIEEQPQRPEGYFYRARYNYEKHDFVHAIRCLEEIMKLNSTKPPTNLWINPKVYDRKYIESLLNGMERNVRQEKISQLQYADPLVPDHIESDFGFSNGCGFGYTSSGIFR